jgi:hypothetical protein
VQVTELPGDSIEERAENYSNDINKFTRETFQKINCKDLSTLIESNKQA